MAMTDATHTMSREQRQALARLTGEQGVDLTRAWVQLWDELRPELEDALNDLLEANANGTVTSSQLRRHKRLTEAMQLAEDRVTELGQLAAETTSDKVDEAVKTGAFNQSELTATQLPEERVASLVASFDRLPIEALDAITLRVTERIYSLSQPLTADMVTAMRSELLRGVAVGANPRVTARRIMGRTEGKFAGGLTRALTIARTETLDAYRAGAKVSDEANADILDGWTWGASLSGRTCAACLSKHGTEYPISQPGPEGHQNCRCARLPKTKSWADLGIKGVTEPASIIPSADDWFKNLTPDSQRTILGKASYDAWARGDFPIDKWAVKRTTPGWRDSWVPAKPPPPS